MTRAGGSPCSCLQAGAQRRHIGIVARLGVRCVQIPAVLHEGAGQEPPRAVFVIGRGVDAGVGRRDHQHLVADLGAAAVLGHERQRRGHVAAHRVAGHRDPAAVRAELFGVARHPLQHGIGLIELRGEARLGQGRVLDEHADLAGADHQIPQQTLMVLEIPDDPDAAVNEQQHAGLTR